MAVKVAFKQGEKVVTGKFASIKGEQVNLFSGCMSDGKGGLRGCGRKQVFPVAEVTVTADSPQQEIKRA